MERVFNRGKAKCAGILNFVKVAEDIIAGRKLQVKLEFQNLVTTPNNLIHSK